MGRVPGRDRGLHSRRVPGPHTAPFGSWRSPISAEVVARAGTRLAEPLIAPDRSAWWLEGRPAEGGRTVLVRQPEGREPQDVTPEGFYVRTRVHEYGGGAWLLYGQTVFFSNFEDQRLYRQDPGQAPQAITPEPTLAAGLRYADGRATPDGRLIVCVRESHTGGDVLNELVAVAADGSEEPLVLATGRDFYSFPRLSPSGELLAFTCWDHPNMPWDGTELWVAELRPEGGLGEARLVAGGPAESIFQPEWSPGGELHFVSDRTGWWNLYRERDGAVDALTAEEAEFGYPQWLFGASTYAFLPDGAIACLRCRRAEERLCLLAPGSSRPVELDLPYTSFGYPSLRSEGGKLVFVAASPDREEAVVSLERPGGRPVPLKSASEEAVDPALAPIPRAVEFPTEGGLIAHAFYYPPTNPGFTGPEGERPPLIVEIHGGPTSHRPPAMRRAVLFWTSRGFGVIDVNYGGSTGYGRAYRERLRGGWGVVDTADCIAAARYLADSGESDGDRLLIHGGSAGGYTTLCALVFHRTFAAGASYYGVADAETLARETHKFESHYLDRLIGPYPAAAETYRERSPIHFVDRLRAPVILFQGLEDEVVPPSQAEQMVAALRASGVPHAYLPFEGEQHGFRRSGTIVRCLEAELYFYGRILGFEPADTIEPVEMKGA
jgi:dipeptidyl aminopeptidase/acylaminoacyl peptidase